MTRVLLTCVFLTTLARTSTCAEDPASSSVSPKFDQPVFSRAPLAAKPYAELPGEVKPESIRLIPFGATTLRIAEFPVVR